MFCALHSVTHSAAARSLHGGHGVSVLVSVVSVSVVHGGRVGVGAWRQVHARKSAMTQDDSYLTAAWQLPGSSLTAA
jgi:hypothetical protein